MTITVLAYSSSKARLHSRKNDDVDDEEKRKRRTKDERRRTLTKHDEERRRTKADERKTVTYEELLDGVKNIEKQISNLISYIRNNDEKQ